MTERMVLDKSAQAELQEETTVHPGPGLDPEAIRALLRKLADQPEKE